MEYGNADWSQEDDVANSAFREFLNRGAEGRFKKLENREDVWQVLALLVGDKIGDGLRHEGRMKRGAGESCMPLEDVTEVVSKLDDPSLEAEINDAKRVFLEKLPSGDHRRVVELLAETGGRAEEIADTLNLDIVSARLIAELRIFASALLKILGSRSPEKEIQWTTAERRGGTK